jgi:hypothetical protein
VHAPDVPLSKLAEFEVHKAELKKDPVVQEMPVQVRLVLLFTGSLARPWRTLCGGLSSLPSALLITHPFFLLTRA